MNFLRACWRDTSRATKLAILCSAGLLALIAATVLTSGCATTLPGLNREQRIYQAGTNIVAQAQTFLPFVPAPVATPVEVVLGLISAGLGAWNLHQQQSIKRLKNGNGNGNGNGYGRPPPSTLNTQPSTVLAQPSSTPSSAAS